MYFSPGSCFKELHCFTTFPDYFKQKFTVQANPSFVTILAQRTDYRRTETDKFFLKTGKFHSGWDTFL